jgi:amino acid adenylation domain-containing protein/non-ribosomal peptide synthase protein (TIGR01720 family)
MSKKNAYGVMDLPLMSRQEWEEVIFDWNRTAADYPRDRCVHELFEQQVELTPEAVAVVYEGERLTYYGLNRRANQLAHYLREMGVGAEVKVGLCVERSLELIVGLLGVMKAGGAYLPLEPDYPTERLAYMIGDGECHVTITTTQAVEKLREIKTVLVTLDADWPRIARESEINLAAPLTADNLAYVIYTSGSTGRPKGVAVPHRQIVNYTTALAEKLQPAAGASFALISTIAADLGNTMLFPCLLGGGRLHLIARSLSRDAEGLGEYFGREQIDYLKIVPSHLMGLHTSRTGQQVMPKRTLVIGGEAASAQWVKQWSRQMPNCLIINHYGPTETTIGALTHTLVKGENWETGNGMIVLGKPINNSLVYILDEQQEPVPVGMAGEIYIGGDGVARGYQNRGGETAEKFIANPFGAAGSRMYRTGDRARYQDDGKVEFLGRGDDQVKIRGYRIELGEIEAALNQHASIEQVVVLAREDEPGERRLVAYMVVNEDVSSQALRAYLGAKLPDYMSPSVFVVLESMPLTANGKIDRRALPRPETNGSAGGYVAPRTAVEEILCDIWAEALGVERVGVEDNFFELGGDSILSIQVIAKARQAGLQLTPRQFFERQTIAELAELACSSSPVECEQGELSGEVPLTPIQEAFFARGLAKPEHYNQAALLQLKPEADSCLLEQAVEGLLRQHDALRLSCEEQEGVWRQRYAMVVAEGAYRRVNFSGRSERERVKAMEEDAAGQQASLSLSAGRMMRAVEYDLGEAGRRLLLIAHHLAVDGVSWRILLDDLQRGYEQLNRGEALDLGAKTTSYRQWAERLEQYSRSENCLEEVEYWERQRRREAGDAEKEEESEGSYAAAGRESRWLDEDQTQELLQEVPGVYHTQINDVLLAVLWEANRRWKGERSLGVELEGHGREEIFAAVDLSRTVGWFTSIYPVKLEAKSERIGEALKEIKELLRAIPKRGIGYGVLKHLSRDEEVVRKLSGGTNADLRFNYLGQFDQVFKAEGVFKPAQESSGPSQAAENRMTWALDVSGMVAGGRLRMDWVYRKSSHSQERVAELADHYMEALEELMAHCRSEEAGGYTPSDFPLAKLDQPALERVIEVGLKVEDIYPLSPMQQGLLFHSLYEAGTGTYYEQMSCRIDGDLKVEDFKRAWQAVVDRHSILRTSFIWEGLKEPVQVVHQELKLKFREEDWRGDAPAEHSRKLEELLKEEQEQGFELIKVPLMKLGLARVAEDAYYFIWGNHHILFDGWCRGVIIEEVFKFYEGYSRGREVEIERVRPYRDYIAWLGEQNLSAAEEFWRAELRGIEGQTELGIERSGGRGQGEYGEKNARISEETSRRLEEVAKKWQVTLNTLVQGAWAVVMSRYSRQREVVFGATVSGRGGGMKGIEGMVGLFINTLPVRVAVREEEQVRGLMRRLHERQSRALEYEYSPLMEVQTWSEAPRGVPLFETIHIFQNYPLDGGIREHAGFGFRVTETRYFEKNNYALALHTAPAKELFLSLQYDDGRYETSSIERLLSHLKRLLEGMEANEQIRVMDLSMMSEKERQEVIAEWNQTATKYPNDRCAHELFEQQVEATPEAVAVIYEGEHITYEGLNRRSNQVGHYLRRLRIAPESVVAIAANRGPGFLISILAIFKAGGCYLPLDPALPLARLKDSLIRSKTRLILSTRESAADIEDIIGKSGCGVPIEVIEDLLEREHNDQNLPPRNNAQNLAYLIYTSGSTGIAKGAMIEQSGMINHLFAKISDLDLTGRDIIAQTASQLFDISVWQFLSSLLVGGRVVIVKDVEAQDPIGLIRVLQEQGMSIAEVVPSLLQALFAELTNTGAKNSLPALRWMLVTGEAFPSELCRRWLNAFPQIQVMNAYGPTECSDDVTHYSANRPSAWNTANVALGKAIANTQIYILSEMLSPVPPGVGGEIYVGGVGVGRGYLDDPLKTSQGFVPDPFSDSIGSRLYRTGDIGRHHEEGDVEYLGRVDHQVKIRGYRIELGDIEAAINEYAFVDQAVVLAREDEPGEKRLVGYVVSRRQICGKELRAYLQERLPDYMAPAAFVQLEKLPLTANGKIDRRSLPRPEIDSPKESFVAPRSAVEEILCELWSEVLRVTRVGITDNFFELGGHSLLAMQLVSRARNFLGVEIPLRSLFTNPTVAAIAAEVEQLKRLGEKTPVPALIRIDRAENMPLSFAQQRLWFIDQLRPGNATYNIPFAVRLSGRLDVDALHRCLNEIVRRHEVLRTVFPSKDGEPRQEVREVVGLRLSRTDMGRMDEAGREQNLQAVLGEEARRGFDLSKGPLIRANLIRMAEDEHILIVVMHHIISDGWSIEIMVGEFSRLYEAFMQGHESPLPELEVQYADYAVWQRAWLQGEVLENQLQYWRDKLDGVAALEMPTDRARPAMAVYSGARESFRFSAELTAKLKQLSKREGVTLFMSLLAGFHTLLARHSGQEDIAVGAPIAGRSRREIEGLIGFFVNTLVMRVNLGGDPTVRELLEIEREMALGAYAHQDVPFEKLVEELQPERSFSHQPLFQVMVAMQNVPREASAIAGLTFNGEPMELQSAKFELTLIMFEQGDEIHGAFEYATELYDGWSIRRLLEHFERVLEGMAKNEQSRVNELPLMSEEERREVIVGWNQTAADYPCDRCTHELFEQQVEWTPDAVAVVYEGAYLTYDELNHRANQLAHYLRKVGVGAEAVVGLCVERSPEMIVGLFGVMKAGGAYLPLDPELPPERLRYILVDAGAGIALTQRELDERLELFWGQRLCLDAEWERIGKESESNPEKERESESLTQRLAYIIYTSGSTGAPKGVAVHHQALVARTMGMIEAYELTSADRLLGFVSPSFDAFGEEVFPALSCGGSLVMDRHAVYYSADDILDMIDRLAVTMLHSTGAYWRQFVTEFAPSQRQVSNQLRLYISGGESPSIETLKKWSVLAPHQSRFANAYGPTEATITSAVYETQVDPAQNRLQTKVPIGRPIANTQIYILDSKLETVPVGAKGELYIGGAGVAREYFGLAEMSAEKFIPDLFIERAGARLYRTGDMGRYLVDGKIEFMGRVDEQVKRRGYRIELGEVETVLLAHPAVQQAVVIVGEDEPGEKRLAAYLVAKEEVGEKDLKKHLREKLPDYMVPSVFIHLDGMPLTANGKIDRKALPKPERIGAFAKYVAPSAAVEEIICGIWGEVLGVEKVGVTDNFFDLGGHSLLATRVVSRMRKALGAEVALRSLFERPTARELAEVVMEERRVGGGVEAPEMLRASREAGLPLSYAQQRLWFMQELEPGSWAYNIPTAVRIVGALDTAALRQSLSEIARRHEALRTSFELREGESVQVIHEPIEVGLVMIEADGVEEGERESVAGGIGAEIAQRAFDLEKGPVWRAALVRIGKDAHVLVVCIHHVASDAWSSGVLIREFTELYETFRGGAQSRLKELEIQYADFAVWQRKWLDGGVLGRQMEYWRRQLHGAPMLNLRKGQETQRVSSRKAGQAPFEITAELTNGLKALSRREGVTLFMTLLAAYQMVLGRYAKQEDVVVGTDIANRNRLEIEGLIGFFVNQLVLRVKLEGALSFRELMGRVREATLGANAHQDVPFEKLVEELAPTRDVSRTPLFEASLVLQNVPQESGRLEGMKVISLPVGEEIAKYTLALRVGESETGLKGALSYAVNAIHQADAELLAAQMQKLLSLVITEYDESLDVLGTKLDRFSKDYREKRKGSLKRALTTKLLAR